MRVIAKVHFNYSYRLLELGKDPTSREFWGATKQLFCHGGFGGNSIDIARKKPVQSTSTSDVTCKRCLSLLGTREFSHIDSGGRNSESNRS